MKRGRVGDVTRLRGRSALSYQIAHSRCPLSLAQEGVLLRATPLLRPKKLRAAIARHSLSGCSQREAKLRERRLGGVRGVDTHPLGSFNLVQFLDGRSAVILEKARLALVKGKQNKRSSLMSHPMIDPVRHELDAIPEKEVKEPDMPVTDALGEGEALHEFLESKEGEGAKNKLLAVGVAPKFLVGLGLALGALRAAQAVFQSKGRRTKADGAEAAETAAYTLRGDIMTACRWNLRNDRIALGALDKINEGEGIQDLLGDLGALAILITEKAAAFSEDTTFKPAERAEACRQSIALVSAFLSDPENKIDAQEALDLRNRAWTYYARQRREIRAAADHAFRHDAKTLKHFFSAYDRARGQKARAAKRAAQAAAKAAQ